jgi:integrase
VEWQWIEANPASRIRRRQEGRGRVRFLSDDERARLLDSCRESKEPRLYPLVIFALTTGARQGELLGLRWRDVDTASDPPRAVLHRTKNRDRRTLSFPGQAAAVLRGLPRFREYLFDTQRGPYFPRKAWLDALAAAQIEDFRFHDLRHSAASYLAMSGATLAEIASFLGHRTLEMVRRYAHLTEQHQEEVARRMADRFLR